MRVHVKSTLTRRSGAPQIGAALSTGAFLTVSIWIGWSELGFDQTWSRLAAPLPAQSHVGVIVFDIYPENCIIVRFDNDSGRIIGLPKRCDDRVTIDSDDDRVPLGTMEAIRKSFQH
jgi:hypothetical protein